MEVVLHASESVDDRFILRGFREHANRLQIEPDLERTFFSGQVCFVRMRAPVPIPFVDRRMALDKVIDGTGNVRLLTDSFRHELVRHL